MRNTYFSAVGAGILGATFSALAIFTVTWMFSIGWPFFDFLLSLLLFAPIPLVLGSVAGILTVYALRNSSLALTAVTAIAGMIGGLWGGIYLSNDAWLFQGYRFWSITYIGIIGIGIIIEVAIILFIVLFKRR